MRTSDVFSIRRGIALLLIGLIALSELWVPKAGAQTAPGASVKLSPMPPDLAQGHGAVAPNAVVTLDNSRPMFKTYSPELRPFDSGNWAGPWQCAGVIDPRITDPSDIRSRTMNGVYYNPNVRYMPPVQANGASFPQAESTYVSVEGIAAARPRQPFGRFGNFYYNTNLPSTDRYGNTPDGPSHERVYRMNIRGTRYWEPKTERREEYWYGYGKCPASSSAGKLTHINVARGCACEISVGSGRGDEFWTWYEASWYDWPDDYPNRNTPEKRAQFFHNQTCRGARDSRWLEVRDVVTGYEERDQRWTCGADKSSPLPGNSGGPYYYRYRQRAPIQLDSRGMPTRTGLAQLYDRNNWEAVPVDDVNNFANWYAYYRTPTLMMRTVLSRAFDKLGAEADGDGRAVRVAWQNVGARDPFHLQDETIITRLSDVDSPVCDAAKVDPGATGLQKGKVRAVPDCYRSAFFNWLFDDNYFAEAPLSSAIIRADKFFQRGTGNTGATGDLHDPYWNPPARPGEDGARLTCRQNFHLVMTDRNAPAGHLSPDADNVRTVYFAPGNPQNLIDQISATLKDFGAGTARIADGAAGTSAPNISAANTSVLVPGAQGYTSGYDPADWSGTFQAVSLDANGKSSKVVWDAGAILDDAGKTNSAARNILTAKWDSSDRSAGVAFKRNSELDSASRALFDDIGRKAGASGQDVVDYLRGDRSKEGSAFRKRSHLLGAIIGSQAVYVGHPSSGYRESWPAGSPERQAMAGDAADCGRQTPSTCRSYEAFVKNNLGRKPVVYVGANDGMLHAFDASMAKDGTGNPAANAGKELFAYMPRSVYANLGNLTSKDNFKFMPTVDGVPVTRDVYFSQGAPQGWRTILVGGLRLGGRGVYALDVTDPASMNAGKVLWEFHAGMPKQPAGSDGPGGDPANLGYTYGQPNIGRLRNGKWAVLVPGGYFPDCAKAAFDGCVAPPAITFSSLFVLDAQTGKLIRELKTSDASNGPASHGLSTPVLGDYDDDQVDDVAFAGDLDGNLWRYDFSSSDPKAWSVTLAFKPDTAGAQPITSMPRLFPDPVTQKLIAVFGTGKYLGADDAADQTRQSVYGIRDVGSTVTRSQLVEQTLSEATADDGKIIARGLTDQAVPANKRGWYFDLEPSTASVGERVIVTPTALFDSGRVVIQTLIPGSDPCDPKSSGALMVVNAANGGSGGGISSLGVSAWNGSGISAVGGRIDNPRTTSGTMPAVSAVGGGSLLIPGLNLSGSDSVLSIDDALWRRRSWRRITR